MSTLKEKLESANPQDVLDIIVTLLDKALNKEKANSPQSRYRFLVLTFDMVTTQVDTQSNTDMESIRRLLHMYLERTVGYQELSGGTQQ